jgi:hypothetical protein
MTTIQDIRKWVEEAQEDGCTHLLVVCDTFEYEDYPVKIHSKDKKLENFEWNDVELALNHFDGPNMQKVMEVYNLSLDIEPQLKEQRTWHK